MTEAQIQSKCVIEFRNQIGRHGKGWLVEINNNQDNAAAAMQRRSLGQVKGWPDTMLVLGMGNVIFVEFKTPKGRIRPEQLKVMEQLISLGHDARVCRSYEDFKNLVNEYGYGLR